MQNNFFDLPKETQRLILSGAETKLNVPPIILEKDIWICWMLRELFTLQMTMSFKGGTSLSKVYGLIKRFSEDLDITIDYRNFAVPSNLDQSMSKTALNKLSTLLKNNVKQYVEHTVLPHIQQRLKACFPNETFKITLSEDGEQLRVFYPTVFASPENISYLQSCVFIEFGGRNSTEPSEEHSITTLLSQAIVELDLPIAQVKVLSPLRTFWEKATLIHVECHRGRLTESPDRLFRHWYDLALLMQSWVGHRALADRELLSDVIRHKTIFFNASYARYDDCLNGCFRLIPNEHELKTLQNDFIKMQESGMFQEKPLPFHEIIDVLKELELQINIANIQDGTSY